MQHRDHSNLPVTHLRMWKHCFLFLIRKFRIKESGIINLWLKWHCLISEQHRRSEMSAYCTVLFVPRWFKCTARLHDASLSSCWSPPTQAKPRPASSAGLMNISTDHHSFLIGSQDPSTVLEKLWVRRPFCPQDQDYCVVIPQQSEQSSTND